MISWQEAMKSRPQDTREPTTEEISQIHAAWADHTAQRLREQQQNNPWGAGAAAWLSIPSFENAAQRYRTWADNPTGAKFWGVDSNLLGNMIQQSGMNVSEGFKQGMQRMPGTSMSIQMSPHAGKGMEQMQLSPHERGRLKMQAESQMGLLDPNRASGAGYNAGMTPQRQQSIGGTSGAGYNWGMSPGPQSAGIGGDAGQLGYINPGTMNYGVT